MKNNKPAYIIAIGASAGGMEEINTFFEHTPLDGVAYVIVQHLSADFKSRMVELLSKHSKLEVRQAKEGIEICTNVVYLIPNDKFMTTKNNRLYLTSKDTLKGPHLTINTFFESLASDNGRRAIGVVLSGLGSDGSDGIIAIKQAGGMVIARNPETSEFSSMPSHAIATGMVDFILEPKFMPQAIESYVKHNDEILQGAKTDEGIISGIIQLISEKLPYDFSNYKMATILRRTKRRAAAINIFDLIKYEEFLKTNGDELKALAQDFLISVTTFFRDAEAFAEMEQKIFPDLIKNSDPDEEIKLWVAGCATGEEAYSLAILLCECLENHKTKRQVKIFATDIDTIALAFAAKGVYTRDKIKNISAERLEKYFVMENENYTIKPAIRKTIIFAKHDLIKNPPYCNMHFISCRNVLIYMTPMLQKKVFTMLLFGLRTQGYLFLGSSENPLPIVKSLEVVSKKWRIYKSLKNKRDVNFDTFVLPEMLDMSRPAASTEKNFTVNKNVLADLINAQLALATDSVAICVNEQNEVIKSYGDTTKYLLQQNFNSNLVELLPKSLAVAYNTLSKEALKEGKPAHVTGILLKHNGVSTDVSLSVSPMLMDGNSQGLLVILRNSNALQILQESYPVFDEGSYNTKYTERLEQELSEIKAKLRISYEKLDASNENMQSFNEELISANEEMQSTNEEMQSVNEELHTINADYQLKNKELVEINDDLNNYFRSNINGQLFIDNNLRLMKFSPAAVKHINLQDSDIGRPISHLSTNIKFDTIIEDTKQVLKNVVEICREIETTDGKWYQVMIIPYLQSGEMPNGAIITFNNITELKAAQRELHNKNTSLTRINADLDQFIHVASHDLLAPLGNIENSISLLSDLQAGDSAHKDFLDIINTSLISFRSLIKDIAKIAKVESDIVGNENANLNEILDNIEWSLKDKISHSGTTIVRSLELEDFVFSKKNLRSILFNLISNAIKFKGTGDPVIKISTFQEPDYNVVTIEDNGKGIAEDGLGKIFNMYGRLQNDIEGSGIGLFLAKKIVNASEGNITVNSALGKGTTFSIYLKRLDI